MHARKDHVMHALTEFLHMLEKINWYILILVNQAKRLDLIVKLLMQNKIKEYDMISKDANNYMNKSTTLIKDDNAIT